MATELPSPPTGNRWPHRIATVLVLAVVAPIGATVLYYYSPVENGFYPGCLFNRLTGMHCPGCGATRGLYSLLHGDLEQAFAYNPLFVILSPLLVYLCWRLIYWIWTGHKAPGPSIPDRGSKALLLVLLAFWIARNIPVDPFNPLAPHPLVPNPPPAPPPPPTP